MSKYIPYSESEEKIRVSIRVRPFLPNEILFNNNSPIIVDKLDDQKIKIGRETNFYESYYDKIFYDTSTQEDVYSFVKLCTADAWNGVNSTILSYGQTGSGKTFTIFGKEWTDDYSGIASKQVDEYNFIYKDLLLDPFDQGNGILPRMINDAMSHKNINEDYEVYCSFVQIYNEKWYDLLNIQQLSNSNSQINSGNFSFSTNRNSTINPIHQQQWHIRDNKEIGIYIEGLSQNKVSSFYDCLQLWKEGEFNRKKRQTSKNELSSRSHTIFMISLARTKPDKEGYISKSRMNFCDLAGSEKYDKNYEYNKIHFNELRNINKSLCTWGNVINALTNKKRFIPYRDSKLTQLLQNSLGGNTKTFWIANISPSYDSYDETLSTLKFADRVHSLFTKIEMNKISENTPDNKDIINKLTKEIWEWKQILSIRQRNGVLISQALQNGANSNLRSELDYWRMENEVLKKKTRVKVIDGSIGNNNIEEWIRENEWWKKQIQNLMNHSKSNPNVYNKYVNPKQWYNVNDIKWQINRSNYNIQRYQNEANHWPTNSLSSVGTSIVNSGPTKRSNPMATSSINQRLKMFDQMHAENTKQMIKEIEDWKKDISKRKRYKIVNIEVTYYSIN